MSERTQFFTISILCRRFFGVVGGKNFQNFFGNKLNLITIIIKNKNNFNFLIHLLITLKI